MHATCILILEAQKIETKKYCNPSHYTALCNKHAGYMEEHHTTQGKTKDNYTNESLISNS